MPHNRKTANAAELEREWQSLRSRLTSSGIKAKDLDDWAKIDYPIFSFKYLSDHSFGNCNNAGFFSAFLQRLRKLSELGWKQIMLSDRHSYGTELIPLSQIKAKHNMPGLDGKDEKLTVFRASGNNLPFVGKRKGNIFYILFIETSFGDVYDHD